MIYHLYKPLLEIVYDRGLDLKTWTKLPRLKPSSVNVPAWTWKRSLFPNFLCASVTASIKSRTIVHLFRKHFSNTYYMIIKLLRTYSQGIHHFLRKRDMFSTTQKTFFIKGYILAIFHSCVQTIYAIGFRLILFIILRKYISSPSFLNSKTKEQVFKFSMHYLGMYCNDYCSLWFFLYWILLT